MNGGYSNGYSLSNTDILGYGTPSYANNAPANAPTDVHLDRSQVWYDLKDDIVLYPRANDADSFWISVHKDGQQLISQGVSVMVSCDFLQVNGVLAIIMRGLPLQI